MTHDSRQPFGFLVAQAQGQRPFLRELRPDLFMLKEADATVRVNSTCGGLAYVMQQRGQDQQRPVSAAVRPLMRDMVA